ncbi:MAG: type 1 glutamine amidotransferase [Actinomycetota bacterium]
MRARPSITVVHLYPDLLMSYGDRGNVLVLQRRAAWRGIEARVVLVPAGEPLPEPTDLVVIGGGSDRVQRLIGDDLVGRRPELAERVADGTAVLGVCAGYQLLGRSYASAEGHDIEGLGLLDLETKAGTGRIIGRVHGKATLEGRSFDLTGFENHGGRTTLGPGATPLATVPRGRGNDGRDRTEGAVQGRVVGTYLHGPVLPTAPDLADVLLSWALDHAGTPQALAPLDDRLERRASSAGLTRPR